MRGRIGHACNHALNSNNGHLRGNTHQNESHDARDGVGAGLAQYSLNPLRPIKFEPCDETCQGNRKSRRQEIDPATIVKVNALRNGHGHDSGSSQ